MSLNIPIRIIVVEDSRRTGAAIQCIVNPDQGYAESGYLWNLPANTAPKVPVPGEVFRVKYE